MNGDIDNDKERPAVTSIGNAWVICNSTSRPGFKYYFNTLSGQAVWNLSPVEIEKAKKYTKALPLSEIEKCPEPSMDPPMDPTMYPSHAATPRVYNEPFGRTQVPNMFPMGLLNVNSMPVVPNISGLNPLVWSNPTSNPTQAPVIYVAYPQMNFQQSHEFPQMFPTQIRDETDNYKKTFSNNQDNDMFNRNNKTYDNTMGQSRFMQRNRTQTSNWNGNSSDLRQKLIRKRSKSISSESAPMYENEDCSYQDFDGQNKNMTVQMDTIETSSKFDLSALKKLYTQNSGASNWFIVVDTEIVLRNFPVLDKITDPDQDCYLMVPDHVMKELQKLVFSEGDVQTRRILRFLSQQIEAELVFKGESMIRIAGNDDTYKMLATCEQLAEQNNVILLSNNPNYQMYKNNDSNIHILTLDELIHILNNAPVKQALRNKSPTLGIKIVVPNTYRDKIVPTGLRPKSPDFEVRPHTTKKTKETIQTHPVPSSSKQTVETLNENSLTQFSEKHFDVVDHMAMKTQESVRIAKLPKSPSLNNDEGGKEVKLSSTSCCKANAKDTPKRLYRWRKRRPLPEKNTQSLSVTDDQTISTNPTKQLEAYLASRLIPESSLKSISPKPISPTQARAEASLSSKSQSSHKDPSHMNIGEETSTSGVASIAALDSASVNPTNIKLKKTVSVCDEINFEMFVVAGQSMEEVLRTRREEWVLRFVQIMEETLKEILRVDSPFQSKCYDYTPMWTADLPELAKCIIKKFSDHFNVVDAANRLSFKLQKINNEGANIEPSQYMDMYSFGVYLINSLKKVTEDCEDLNTADESLKKLLFDIQNANLDTSHNDTFADELTESAINVSKPPPPEKKLPHEFFNGASKKTDGYGHHNTNSKGNTLLSRTRSHTQINKEQNIETQFLSSLGLEKRMSPEKPSSKLDFLNTKSPNTQTTAQTPPQVSPLPKTPLSSPVKLKATTIQADRDDKNKDLSKSNSDVNLNTDKDVTSSPIKTCFVRNFNSIPQFEEIINKKGQTANEFANEEGDYDDADYADECYVDTYCDNELEDGEIVEGETAEDFIEIYNDEENVNKENDVKFEWFIKEFADKIRRTIKIVLTLCIKFGEEAKNSHGPSQEIKDQMKTACASISSIKNELSRMLDSDFTSLKNDVVNLLKKANLDDYVPNKELLLEYRNVVIKCSEQVHICYAKVTQTMKVAGIEQVA